MGVPWPGLVPWDCHSPGTVTAKGEAFDRAVVAADLRVRRRVVVASHVVAAPCAGRMLLSRPAVQRVVTRVTRAQRFQLLRRRSKTQRLRLKGRQLEGRHRRPRVPPDTAAARHELRDEFSVGASVAQVANPVAP